jgi:hypothetical protein
MTHWTLKLVLPVFLACAAGCTTMGTGVGSSATGATTVNFSWKSTDSISGTMNAVLVTNYSGQVVANLGAPSGEHMRCKFRLVHPSNGMAGGKTIDATFPIA